MEWKTLQSFLLKAKTILGNNGDAKNSFSEACKSLIGADIATSSVEVRGGKMYVSAHPIIKNEILLKKKEILFFLQQKNPTNLIRDIL